MAGIMPFRVFIGYDSKEPVAYHVLSHSLMRHSSIPLAITPLARHTLNDIHTRERGPYDSTEFAITRFLVPYLSGYEGYSLFLDCDMLCKDDVAWMLPYALAYPDKAVHVVQHHYTPKSERKFLDQPQTTYQRKNWSSVMLFNNAQCQKLTPAYVNDAPGLDLHQFAWLKDEQIGSLPLEWNWLVGEYEPNEKASLLHYTLGGPWFTNTEWCPHHSPEWLREHLFMEGEFGE